MKIEQVKTIAKKVVTDVMCDLCGESCTICEPLSEGSDNHISYGQLKFQGHYGSHHDTEYIEMDICEKCVYDMVENAKHCIQTKISPWMC